MIRWTLAPAALLLTGAYELAAQGKGIRFWNLTTATISSFQLSPAGKETWGPNQTLNDKDKEVDHDERLRITSTEPGRYDAKIGYRNSKQCIVRDIEIKADAVFSIADKDLKDCNR
jgi:nitric oxide synthase oxygenase domain/subunit